MLVHPLAPRALGSPVHTHRNEDEFSYVLEGEVGAEIGGRALVARPGDLIVKPRGVPHAFWNPSDAPARILEVITPGGFEHYFAEIGALLGAPGGPDFPGVVSIAERFGLEVDETSLVRLVEEHGLNVGP
ncbi:MAG: cupin domain-containing protein [Actinobacteria bacterium]|nr:cupin domain-containing protein [Actinomycetota bacterium]